MAINGTPKDKAYSVRCDGNEIKRIFLAPEECGTQAARNIIRQKIADHHSIPRHYLRLVPLVYSKYRWNEVTQKNEPIEEKL